MTPSIWHHDIFLIYACKNEWEQSLIGSNFFCNLRFEYSINKTFSFRELIPFSSSFELILSSFELLSFSCFLPPPYLFWLIAEGRLILPWFSSSPFPHILRLSCLPIQADGRPRSSFVWFYPKAQQFFCFSSFLSSFFLALRSSSCLFHTDFVRPERPARPFWLRHNCEPPINTQAILATSQCYQSWDILIVVNQLNIDRKTALNISGAVREQQGLLNDK